ncbi:hypothetical protein HLB01_03845 [Bordetella trematum]|uniref:capsular polysaccharide export protein, LipB/KpsS family n=1 Tax=Bordetella trematum TaxID=123899 RepID=UPI0011C07554|nr:hypothetical protein [Bordetella trematum]NNH18167.1 hypothetical protein [Bordetella trematum]
MRKNGAIINGFLGLFRKESPRKEINRNFSIRDKFFSRKKKGNDLTYPCKVIDPYLIFGEEMPKCKFSLVGDNWLNTNSSKPVAILWGFNDWKWGFISDYLQEYRIAFAPRKILPWRAFSAMRSFPLRSDVFIVWGYTESSWLRLIAKISKSKIYRMEDGFLRSSNLGAAHTTPYSLILDSGGLHYDSEGDSDVERILNKKSFSSDDLVKAAECLRFLRGLGLSKYNPPTSLDAPTPGIKTRRRIAVLGQVDNDMSVRLGNPDGWSMVDMIKLAKLEHPDAEILYRPHPEVYLGYQRSKFKSRRIKNVCTVVSPDSSLIDFLESVDHVYTLTSLSGFEALLRGVSVTVLGTPFYAGWGLTDDRVKLPHRKVELSIEEIFAGAYLKYPRYLADLSRPDIGFKAAALRITADRMINGSELAKASLKDTSQLRLIAKSDFWPKILFSNPGVVPASLESLIPSMDMARFLNNAPGPLLQYSLLLAVCGKITNSSVRDAFLNKVRNYIDPQIYNKVVLLLHEHASGTYVHKQMSWLLLESDEYQSAAELLKEALRSERSKPKDEQFDVEEAATTTQEHALSPDQQQLLRNLYDVYYSERNFDQAILIAGILLVAGCADYALLLSLARLAELKFDLRSAYGLADVCMQIDPFAMRSAALNIKNKTLELNQLDADADISYMSEMALFSALKPDQIEAVLLLLKKYKNHIEIDGLDEIFLRTIYLDNDISSDKALAYKAIGDNSRAIEVMESVIASGNNSDSAILYYSQCLSFANEVDRALSIVLPYLEKRDSKILYDEAIRLLIISGDFERAYRLIKRAELKKIPVSDMLRTKTLFGSRKVKEAHRVYTEIPFRKLFYSYYKDKYFNVDEPDKHGDSLLGLAIYGPGDEIRFSSIYNRLPSILPHPSYKVSCDPRLFDIFTRSFPKIEFQPVARRRFHEIVDFEQYSLVPGSDLIGALDNNGVKALNDADQVMLITDLLHVCLPDYDSFEREPYLFVDQAIVSRFKEELPAGQPLVGLSWRSSLTTHSRNSHYLSIEELDSIFQIEGIQFVNFQYDECSDELAWVEERYPGKLLNIASVDHYNDFDSVAALMKCMDLIIAPATTVVELSGALGCPTWLLSNSAELHWRRINENGDDAWHENTKHIEGSVLGDKSTLVEKLHSELKRFSLANRG